MDSFPLPPPYKILKVVLLCSSIRTISVKWIPAIYPLFLPSLWLYRYINFTTSFHRPTTWWFVDITYLAYFIQIPITLTEIELSGSIFYLDCSCSSFWYVPCYYCFRINPNMMVSSILLRQNVHDQFEWYLLTDKYRLHAKWNFRKSCHLFYMWKQLGSQRDQGGPMRYPWKILSTWVMHWQSLASSITWIDCSKNNFSTSIWHRLIAHVLLIG